MKKIDGLELKQLFLSGSNNLYNHYPEIDRLNVFPVPDGDTGMNMNLTLTSGAKEIQNRNDPDVGSVASQFSRGLMIGARGNSGVITSQIFSGFAKSCAGKDKLDVIGLAEAFANGKEIAYKAVKKPVEGTILTVIRESSAALLEKAHEFTCIENALEYIFEQARESLKHTPDLLPVLKQVGVVDSGGAGLTVILEGMVLAAQGHFVERNSNLAEGEATSIVFPSMNDAYAGAKLSEDEEGYGYCTQMLVRLGKEGEGKKEFDEKKFQSFLSRHGKSLVVVRDDDLVKVHVHTLTPGAMLNYAQQYGEFLTITIENMSEEHHNIEHGNSATDMESNIARNKAEKEAIKNDEPLKEYGLIAVSSGSGLDELFKELGVDVIVSGGQTMNPSTQDFLDAIEKAHAKNIFILPNNGNIVMAASLACQALEGNEINAKVVKSKTINQGLTALMDFSSESSPDEAYQSMKEAMKRVRSGSVTYAIRDADINDMHITKDYYMAMREDKDVVSCVKDREDALFALVDALKGEDGSMATLIIGKDIPEENIDPLSTTLQEKYPDLEWNIMKGDQPIHCYLLGIE